MPEHTDNSTCYGIYPKDHSYKGNMALAKLFLRSHSNKKR